MTTQLDLLAATPAARSTDPVSSHVAAEQVTRSGVRARQQAEVARLVRERQGHTAAELARHSLLNRYQISRRLPELEPVHVQRSSQRICRVTGNTSLTWVVGSRP